MGRALALGGCRLMILHTTTSQKQSLGMEGSMKGRFDWVGARVGGDYQWFWWH